MYLEPALPADLLDRLGPQGILRLPLDARPRMLRSELFVLSEGLGGLAQHLLLSP
jgi:hypothetical protein